MDKADRLEKRFVPLHQLVDRIENRVANKADRIWGWKTWRRDLKLLRKVAFDMAKASAHVRVKIVDTHAKIERLRKPCLDDLHELDSLHTALLRDVAYGLQ